MANKKRSQLLPPRDFTGEVCSEALDSLSFVATNETGSEATVINLEALPGSRLLKRELLGGLIRLNGPRGLRRSIHSIEGSKKAISSFLRWVDEQGYQVQSVADINVALWNKWLLRNGSGRTTSGYAALVNLRAVLRATQLATPDLEVAMSRRITKGEPRLQESYSEEEFRQIRRLARKSIHTAARRISANYQLLLRLQAGLPVDAKIQCRAQALLELFETGDVSTQAAYDALGARDSMGRGSLRPLRAALLLTPREGWAAAVLLAAEAGWNRSVIERMQLPDNSVGAGEASPVYSVAVYKPRQGPNRQHSTSIEPATDGAGRALSWLISATEPARAALARFDVPTDRLLIYGRWNSPTVTHLKLGFGIPKMRDSEQATAPEQPIPSQLVGVSLQKLRRTRQVVFDRSPAQNSRTVHEETYVRNDSATREQVRPVIEEGINNALLHASATIVMRLVAEGEAGEDICSGKLDTAVAACRDYAHHPETGQPCKDSFLACLGCANAIATPRHLARIVALHDALLELSGCLDQTDWAERWEVHFYRLRVLLDRYTSEAERLQARQSVKESDRAVVARLLSGGVFGRMTRPVGYQDDPPWSVGPDEPAIEAGRVHDAQHTISRYGDRRWDLRPLGGPPGSSPRAIIFDGFPESLRETFRRAAWLVINTPTPAVMLERPGSCAVEYLGAGSIALCVGGRWRWFATWLHEEGYERLCDVTRSDLERFAKRVQKTTYTHESKLALLAGVTRLWAYATQLPDRDVLPMPPWEDEGLALFLPGGDTRRDNATPIVHPSTMAPLLFWAQEFLKFAVDIQAAQRRWQELLDSMPATRSGPQRQRAVALVSEWIAAGRVSLPESPIASGRPDFEYLAAVHGGIHVIDLHSALRTRRRFFVADRSIPSPIDSPVMATVDGKPWCSAVNRRELQTLNHAVEGAALVVLTYLTGMRPNEVLALKPGCCVRERTSATAVRYTVHGRKFKHVRTNGSTKPDGVESSWVTIAPALKAVEAMARLFPDGDVLFPSPRDRTVPMSTDCASERIAALILAANGIVGDLDLPQSYSIPDDPAGAVTLKRFRRTLAWHIRRLPHGRVALAVQYGHLRFSHGSGYAGLATSGFAKLMDREEVTALRETVELTRRELADGGGVSGPAAKRLIDLVGRGIDFEGAYLTDREVRRIKADTRLKLYDNPHSYVACLFDPERSLCRNPRTMAAITEPKLEKCQPNCPNIARTDRHIAQLAGEVDRLRSEAASPLTPTPMAQRMESEAERLTAIIDTHRATAIRPEAMTKEVSA